MTAVLVLLMALPPSVARAAVDVVVAGDVPAEVASEARVVVADTWAKLNEHWWRVTSTAPPWSARVSLRRATSLSTQLAASSTPGAIALRTSSSTLNDVERLALVHEVVHQHLWAACPKATRDRLFHEAVAVALSGEAAAWDSERYRTLPETAATLTTADLDTPAARRALARLVRESTTTTTTTTTTTAMSTMRLPTSLQQQLRRCVDGAAWRPLTVQQLVGLSAIPTGEALVVVNRHSGEVVEARGAVDLPLPFGSTLKPVLFAAALDRGATLPTLSTKLTTSTWACGVTTSTMTPTTALLQSCNGWFLDWAQRDPRALELGAWGTLLAQLGLTSLPTEMSEAIGARTSLRLSAKALAELYRVLSFRRGAFDVLKTLQQRGTLDGADGVVGLDGMAAKTGTVRDEASRPVLGWLVAVDDDVVIVRVRPGVPARSLVNDVAAARARRAQRIDERVPVQTFALLPANEVRARCPLVAQIGRQLRVRSAVDDVLTDLVAADTDTICIGAPWQVPVAGEVRPYAGTFAWSPPSSSSSSSSSPSSLSGTAKQQAARRGSSFVFSTSRLAYVRAVLDAEDSGARGEARLALARVIDHDVDHADERHGARPVCDTTHCQTFLGTRHRHDDVGAAALSSSLTQPLSYRGWLPFSQGGSSPWTQTRTVDAVRTAIGSFSSIRMKDGAVVVVRVVDDASGSHDDVDVVSCERLRGPLQLPSCPTSVKRAGDVFNFDGVGAGHGLGLDVERAKQQSAAGQSASEILRTAYGAP